MIELSDSDDDIQEINEPDVKKSSESPSDLTVTVKSQHKYSSTYNKFIEWKERNEKKEEKLTEKLMIKYFIEMSSIIKPSSLYARYSMLKTMIKIKNNIDISNFKKLNPLLKKQSFGFHSPKAEKFTATDVDKFLNEAPDTKYLIEKVALIFGICGGCRRDELSYMTIDDIDDDGIMLLIKISKLDEQEFRTFAVINDKFYKIYKKYALLRPENVRTNRFFLQLKRGKCIHRVIGINRFGRMPKRIASYLKLKNLDGFTGHSFKRTSTSLLNNGGYSLTLQKLKGINSRIAETAIDESIFIKRQICGRICESIRLKPTNNKTNLTSKSFDTKCKNNNISLNNGAGTSKTIESVDQDKIFSGSQAKNSKNNLKTIKVVKKILIPMSQFPELLKRKKLNKNKDNDIIQIELEESLSNNSDISEINGQVKHKIELDEMKNETSEDENEFNYSDVFFHEVNEEIAETLTTDDDQDEIDPLFGIN